MTTTSSVPERVVDLAAARTRHGDHVDLLVEMLQVGDPLADAVIAEFDRLGRPARTALQQGLTDGLASVPDAPPAVTALLTDVESVPFWVAPDLLDEGDRISLAVPVHWRGLASAAGSLAHTYASPSMARLLAGTGQLTAMAGRRLAETGLWNASAMLPGGLHPGAPGYVQTVQVRLLHARVRASALGHGWETGRFGVPINQADLARTWLDFTVVPFTLLEGIGYRLTEDEQSRLYRYWWHIARLLGLDERYFLGVDDHAGAAELLDLFDSTAAAPDENSRALVGALFDAAVTSLTAAPQSPLDRTGWQDLLNALARSYHGDDTATALGIPESPVTAVLPLIGVAEAKARRHQLADPDVLRRAEAEGTGALNQLIASITGTTPFQDNVATS